MQHTRNPCPSWGKLRFPGIDDNASLSVLSIELMPRYDFHSGEPGDANVIIKPLPSQDLSLDKVRILKTSKLCPVSETCAVLV